MRTHNQTTRHPDKILNSTVDTQDLEHEVSLSVQHIIQQQIRIKDLKMQMEQEARQPLPRPRNFTPKPTGGD